SRVSDLGDDGEAQLTTFREERVPHPVVDRTELVWMDVRSHEPVLPRSSLHLPNAIHPRERVDSVDAVETARSLVDDLPDLIRGHIQVQSRVRVEYRPEFHRRDETLLDSALVHEGDVLRHGQTGHERGGELDRCAVASVAPRLQSGLVPLHDLWGERA